MLKYRSRIEYVREFWSVPPGIKKFKRKRAINRICIKILNRYEEGI